MCGRTACTLAPDQVCQACSFPSRHKSSKNFCLPQWKNHPGNHTYSPSTNVAPTTFTPVLIKSTSRDLAVKRDVDGNEKMESKYVVQPMMWGLVPPFFKSDSPKGHGFKTSNCRIEDIDAKKIFKPSLNKGQRCVVLCDGFYEWQTTKASKNKQPYFIHAPQPEKIEIWNKEKLQSDELWSEEEGWKGAKLLKMAGLYSHWTSTEGEEIYSYSVITMESDDKFSWIHHRIPAILETDDDVERWLQEENYKIAVSNLRNNVAISSYPVSSLVNNTRNKDENLFTPVPLDQKPPESASSKFMTAWLSSAPEKPKMEKRVNPMGQKEIKPQTQKGVEKWLKEETKS